jgi:hypothetical protein
MPVDRPGFGRAPTSRLWSWLLPARVLLFFLVIACGPSTHFAARGVASALSISGISVLAARTVASTVGNHHLLENSQWPLPCFLISGRPEPRTYR